jgi:hypothetical protein
MFSCVLVYHSIHLQPRLLLQYVHHTSPVMPSFKLQVFKSFCIVEPRLTTANVINRAHPTHPCKYARPRMTALTCEPSVHF